MTKKNVDHYDILNGKIPIPKKFGKYELTWSEGIDFTFVSTLPESVKWWLSCLGFLRIILKGSYEFKVESICKNIIEDFFEHNRKDMPSFNRAWDGHAVALRSGVLIDVYNYVDDRKYLLKYLEAHKIFLQSEDNFQGNWNHGVDQASALIDLSILLSDETALTIALNRFLESLMSLVDDEGVTIEQSIHYQLYNYKQIKSAIKKLESIHLEKARSDITLCIRSLKDRLAKMESFLTHATDNFGNFFEVGDTPHQKAEAVDAHYSLFAATQGKKGTTPPDLTKQYTSGYAFGRFSWKENQGESYCIKYGPPRAIHGHHDNFSMIYNRNNYEVIRDGGFHGYTDDINRAFLRSDEAHNTLLFYQNGKKLTEAAICHLDYHEIKQFYHRYDLRADFSYGCQERKVFVSDSPNALVIIDSVRSDKFLTVEQIFHLNRSFAFRKASETTILSENNDIYIHQHYPVDKIMLEQADSIPDSKKLSSGKMYERISNPKLTSIREGKSITFLTTIITKENGRLPKVLHTRAGNSEVRRKLEIIGDKHTFELSFMADSTIVSQTKQL